MKPVLLRALLSALVISALPYTSIAANNFQTFNPALHEKIDGKYAMKNQLLVAVRPGTENASFMRQFSKALDPTGHVASSGAVISSKSAEISIIKVNVNTHQSLASIRETMQKMPNVLWVQPNYIYNINFDPTEEMPNDPMLEKQYHHQLMQNIKAWDIATGKNVLIAITDNGFDLQHEDLASRFVPGKGYNFCDNNANVMPATKYDDHGTHVAGIAAAEMNNGKGGSGVAGNANVLPVKFYSGTCNWTSELIYKAYQYSVDNGAKIISTSYNVDQFVNDKTFIAALDYVYDKGVLHFNSAGNNDDKDPPRESFRELILVASTNQHDIKSDFSNYGSGVQISAPGDDILSTVPNNKYEEMSGTSMATPNASGSAALIWSAHPDWNRDQVAAQLIGTADNIDDINPEYKGMLGAGRINNYRALTEKLAPARVVSVDVRDNENATSLAIHFDKLLDPKIMNKGKHWHVKSLADSSDIPVTTSHRWFIGSMTLDLALPKLKPGKYELTMNGLKDPFGQAMSTDKSNSKYVYVFEVV